MSNYYSDNPTASYKLIYVYKIEDGNHNGYVKIGEHTFNSLKSKNQLTPDCDELRYHADIRVKQQTRTAMVKGDLLYAELALREIVMQDGTKQDQYFSDNEVRQLAVASGYEVMLFPDNGQMSEWYKIDLDTAKRLIEGARQKVDVLTNSPNAVRNVIPKKTIKLRHEQKNAVEKTVNMFEQYDEMLWNCKMRFGKTVTAYQLIKEQGYKKVIVVTHRPAVQDGWKSDHDLIFAGTDHKFKDRSNEDGRLYNASLDLQNERDLKKLVNDGAAFTYFASIQDLRGSKRAGGKFKKNEYVFDLDWDLVIIDEAHEGTQTPLGDSVIKELTKNKPKLLMLSGTPYNIMDGFSENIFSWSYENEQNAKENWDKEHPGEPNPYADLPKMNILTFDISNSLEKSYRFVKEDMAFNFKEFFRTWTGDIKADFKPIPEGQKVGDFVYEDSVEAFLDLISAESDSTNYPFATEENREFFKHTFWMLPGTKEAKAFSKLLKAHPVFMDYQVVNVAGDGDDEKPCDEALAMVRSAINAFDKTITISCGRLNTGVTVREWTAVMMLSGSSSTAVSTYMQTIFRAQSPGVIDGRRKENCYVFDFAPDRALKVVAEAHKISNKKASKSDDDFKQVLGQFLNFCPIIAFDGTKMETLDVPKLMRTIRRISVENAINSGFDDDTIYKQETGIIMNDVDKEILKKLSDVVVPQKKGKKQTHAWINETGMTDEQRQKAKDAQKKKREKKKLTPEEQEALDKLAKQKKEQKKILDLLRSISIRLPLLFFGADGDFDDAIKLEDFVNIVDDESWQEFMPQGLKKDFFLDLLRFYDDDVIIGAGMRIRKMAKAADELMPTYRARQIVEIISKFKNPDKETVLTPWRVVNMHMGDTIGGYNFFNEDYTEEISDLDDPRFIEHDGVTDTIFLNDKVKILEMNSKSGLYPLYLAYTIYMLKVDGKEKDFPYEKAMALWQETLEENIYVLCKTKMAASITRRTLAGFTDANVNTLYLTKLIERMRSDVKKTSNKITNPQNWGKEGDRLKFDAVVGNPPYQEGISTGDNESLSRQLFPDFIKLAYELKGEYVSLITPSRWFAGDAQDKSFLKLREFIRSKNDLKYIHHYENANDIFPTVVIKGGISYFLYDSLYSGDTNFCVTRNGKTSSTLRSLFEENTDVIIADTTKIVVMKKVKSASNFDALTSITQGRNAFGIIGKETVVNEISQEKPFNGSCELRCKGNEIRYITEDYVTKNRDIFTSYKVFISKSAGDPSKDAKVIGTPYIGNPNSACTDSLIPIGCFDNKNEAINLQKYLSTKFLRFLVSILKVSQNVSQNVYQFVPIQDFTEVSDIDWSKSISDIDKQLYSKYGLSNEEIDLIEKSIKPME